MKNYQASNIKFQISTKNQAPRSKPPYDLEQRTLEFAKGVIRLCQKVDSSPITREIVSQLVRASGSVGANYREANETITKRDFSHRIRIALKEAKEAHYWLALLAEAAPSINGDVSEAQQEALELKKILSAIAIKSR